MATLTQMAVSTQPVLQEVKAVLEGVRIDPTGDPVSMAFMLYPNFGDPPSPEPGDMHTAFWTTDFTGLVPTYWAGCSVGSENDAVSLPAGRYKIAVKITDDPDVPVLWGWDLVITG